MIWWDEEQDASIVQCAQAFLVFVDNLSGPRCKTLDSRKLYKECQFLVANDIAVEELEERYDDLLQFFPSRPRQINAKLQKRSDELYDNLIEALSRAMYASDLSL